MQAASLSTVLRRSISSVFVQEFQVISSYHSVHVRVVTVASGGVGCGEVTAVPAV